MTGFDPNAPKETEEMEEAAEEAVLAEEEALENQEQLTEEDETLAEPTVELPPGGISADELAQNIAQQVGQQIGQSIAQEISKLSALFTQQTSAQTAGAVDKTGIESVLSDPGIDEAWKAIILNMVNNTKRTADEYQQVSLAHIGQNRVHFDQQIADSMEDARATRVIARQALQNAVETANIVGKQSSRHSDIAIDRQWNVDEVAGFVQKILAGIQDPAIASSMATAIANAMLSGKSEATKK